MTDMKEVMLCCFMLFLYSCTSATSSLNNLSSSASVDMKARMENKVGSEGQANNNNYNTIRRSIGEEIKNGHGGVGGGQGGSAGNGGDNGPHQPGSSIPIYAANSHQNPHHGKGSASTMTKPCPLAPALSATLLLLFLGSGFSPIFRI
ncbi:PREDICTED: uncharacterized protein LOC109176826 isoform X1 [Ipomoea nil]|uniref:uncharacterized protein LOC109176826 isoform X1 n=1 Tax=Ipomoea nil TaxID=35883 RepID=UPI000900ECAB|nr:PREDICTED: uncharacterized protein LOC109176826 isoform X1 [Ipomoea nil]